MANIRIMEQALANQIAAGEVVERPASVVKELVENALDAEATQIDIEISEGGLQIIRVADNGTGMDPEDASLCFERHATSKIREQRDLFRIRTLGFRGEALPSIAAVAKVELQTKTAASERGVRLIVEGGQVRNQESVARNTGTDVIVRDLFYNTPARLKYVKSLQTEFHHISDYISRMAILRSDVKFRLYHQERLVFQTPGDGQLLHVIAAVYGNEVAKRMILLDWKNNEYSIYGCIGAPELSRASRQHLNLFVNGRSIRNYAIYNGILRAYHTRLPIHRYPIVAIVIDMDPVLFDPNVHPNKTEVRFSEEADVVAAVTNAIQSALEEQAWIPHASLHTQQSPQAPKLQESESFRNVNETKGTNHSVQQRWTNEQLYGGKKSTTPVTTIGAKSGVPTVRQWQSIYQVQPDQTAPTLPLESTNPVVAVPSVQADLPTDESLSAPRFRAVAQVLGMYVIAQDEQTMYIIDQHAAHERILFETFTKKMKEKGVRKLPLLVPYSYEVRTQDMQLVKERTDTLAQIGMEIESFGGHTVLVRTVPDIWEGLETQRLVQETLDELFSEGLLKQPLERIEEHVIMKSCKAAIKANHWLSMPEMQALCDQLCNLENPFSCPHGRPVIIKMTAYELEKQFKRIQ